VVGDSGKRGVWRWRCCRIEQLSTFARAAVRNEGAKGAHACLNALVSSLGGGEQ